MQNTTTFGLNVFDKAAAGPSILVRNTALMHVARNATVTYPCPPQYKALKKCSEDRIVSDSAIALTGGLEPKHPGTYPVGGLTLDNVTVVDRQDDRDFILMSSSKGFGKGCVAGNVTVRVTKAADCAVPASAAAFLRVHCVTDHDV